MDHFQAIYEIELNSHPKPFKSHPKLGPPVDRGVAAFARVALLSHSEVLLVFFPAASENEAVACSREILVFSRLLYSQRCVFGKKCKELIVLAKSSVNQRVLKSETTLLRNVTEQHHRHTRTCFVVVLLFGQGGTGTGRGAWVICYRAAFPVVVGNQIGLCLHSKGLEKFIWIGGIDWVFFHSDCASTKERNLHCNI